MIGVVGNVAGDILPKRVGKKFEHEAGAWHPSCPGGFLERKTE